MAKNFYERNRQMAERYSRMESGSTGKPETKDGKPKDPKNKASIIINPVEMEGTYTSKILTSQRLCGMINKIMYGVSPDYDGCRITVQGYEVVCDLFFAENPHATLKEHQIKMIQHRDAPYNTNGRARDIGNIIERHNMRTKNGAMYELTESGKEALEDFLPNFCVRDHQRHIYDWSRAVSEDVEKSNFAGQNKILLKFRFDLPKFLQKVYGRRSGDGSRYIYEINIMKPLDEMKMPNGNIYSTKWQLNVLQMDEENLKTAYEESGLSPLQNTLNIIR